MPFSPCVSSFAWSTHFERAAWGYETLGAPFPAAEATLEFGRCLLFSRRGEWLPKLAGRLANLATEEAASLPPGGLVTLLVWATILRQGEAEPLALVQLIRARRRARSATNPQPPHQRPEEWASWEWQRRGRFGE